MTADFITGRPIPTMLRFMLPILLGNLFQQLYNTVDAIIVGRFYGESALAAIGVANPIMSIAIFLIFGVCVGLSILLAQVYGSGDWKLFKEETSTALIAGTVFSIVISVLCYFVSGFVLRITNTPPEIIGDAYAYLKIISCGLIFSFLYNFYASVLRAMGDSRTPFLFLLFSSLVNVALDFVFVAGLEMGVPGAAVATVISQGVSSLLCIRYVYRNKPLIALRREEFIFEGRLLRRILGYSWASALQQTFLYIGRLLVQGAVNPFGTGVIAAYNGATRIEAFVLSVNESMSSSESTFCAQNKGAGQEERVFKGFWGTAIFNFCTSIVISTLLYFAAPFLMMLFVKGSETDVVAIGAHYLRTMAVFYIIAGVNLAFQGFFRGVGLLKVTVLCTGVQILCRVALSYAFAPRFGIDAICYAVGVGWIMMVVIALFVFRKYSVFPQP